MFQVHHQVHPQLGRKLQSWTIRLFGNWIFPQKGNKICKRRRESGVWKKKEKKINWSRTRTVERRDMGKKKRK